ncbi:restriction endonuclease subunit S [Staphylococcus succinus]|uniref:restriction endonuclease subunit S n=1 Tax=Staphylococcus succinus TaxID=61015 RepID=UPI000E69E4BC|nr:restriction endonuclease subunit S [Staphylococcus succinus]RIN28707.1 restriction endonuclease subunit S [Staphylococcus succinus]
MTNEVKNVPALRFPEYSEEWEVKKLGEIAIIKGRLGWKGLKNEEYIENGYAYLVAGRHIKNGVINWSSTDQINKYRYDESPEIALEQNDIIFSKDGSLGNPALIKSMNKPATINGTMMLVRVDTNKLNPHFFYQILLSSYFKRLIHLKVSGSSIPHLFQADMKAFSIKATNLSEQEKIGDFFSKLDRQIELEEQKLAKLEEQKKGYMQKIFSQELRFKDGNGNNYSEWIKTNLKFLVSYKNGKGYEKEVVQNGKYNIINLNSISTKGMLKDSGKYSDFEDITLKKNDLIMILSDVAKGNLIGKTAIIDQDDKYLLNQRVASLRIKDESTSNVLFIYYFINYFRQYFINMSTGMSQLNINKSTVEDFLIYLPYIEEQDKIGNFFSNLDKSIIKQLDKIELLKERKKGFLQKMFV